MPLDKAYNMSLLGLLLLGISLVNQVGHREFKGNSTSEISPRPGADIFNRVCVQEELFLLSPWIHDYQDSLKATLGKPQDGLDHHP